MEESQPQPQSEVLNTITSVPAFRGLDLSNHAIYSITEGNEISEEEIQQLLAGYIREWRLPESLSQEERDMRLEVITNEFYRTLDKRKYDNLEDLNAETLIIESHNPFPVTGKFIDSLNPSVKHLVFNCIVEFADSVLYGNTTIKSVFCIHEVLNIERLAFEGSQITNFLFNGPIHNIEFRAFSQLDTRDDPIILRSRYPLPYGVYSLFMNTYVDIVIFQKDADQISRFCFCGAKFDILIVGPNTDCEGRKAFEDCSISDSCMTFIPLDIEDYLIRHCYDFSYPFFHPVVNANIFLSKYIQENRPESVYNSVGSLERLRRTDYGEYYDLAIEAINYHQFN